MPVIRIDQIDDQRLDDYRNVLDAELLRHRNLFVGEGRLVVRRLLSSGHAVVSLLLNEPSFKDLEPDFGQAFDRIPVYVCPTAELAGIVGFNLHRGCLALAHRPADAAVTDITAAATRLLILEGVTDADNVGSAFRNAAAFGVDGVLLTACCDPLYRKAVRTSMGQVLQMPYARLANLSFELKALKSSGFTLLALTPAPHVQPISDWTRSSRVGGKLAVLAGSEVDGLSSQTMAMADACVRIPMRRGVDSLNLATAIAVALDRLTNP
jgi:tRNA G18 (ribose-2'-O)-methylase SpoU